MKGIIRFCKFWEHSLPISANFGRAVDSRNSKCTYNSPSFYFRETEKIKFGIIQVLWDCHTKEDTEEESTFFRTIWLWQLTWSRYKFPAMACSEVISSEWTTFSGVKSNFQCEIIFWFNYISVKNVTYCWQVHFVIVKNNLKLLPWDVLAAFHLKQLICLSTLSTSLHQFSSASTVYCNSISVACAQFGLLASFMSAIIVDFIQQFLLIVKRPFVTFF